MTMDANRRQLRERFIARLLEHGPSSVLDVGCGGGELLAACRAAGAVAWGVEPWPKPEAGAAGARLIAARAEALPLPADAVAWATLRHVAHHLVNPARALAELMRVARVGVMVAEPYYDLNVPSQRLGSDFDRWLKQRDRERGEPHRDVLPAAELLAGLGPGAGCRVSVESYLELTPWQRADVDSEVQSSVGERALAERERATLAPFLEASDRGDMTLAGTVIVTLRKRV